MSTKSKGFIKMEWTCPNCNTRNPGPVKTCQSCGAPQPENVKFEMGADQNFVKDDKEIEQAKKGADIHCGFCGTRNPADAKSCSQCGGDLKEGMKRQAGTCAACPACRSAVRISSMCARIARLQHKVDRGGAHWKMREGALVMNFFDVGLQLRKQYCHLRKGTRQIPQFDAQSRQSS